MPSINSFHDLIATIGLVVWIKFVPSHCFASLALGFSIGRRNFNNFSPKLYSHPKDNLGNDVDLKVEDNPTIDPNTVSLSRVCYGDVLDALETIYPKQDLSKRNAISRKDGYWQFIESGEEPPKFLTYGEFDLLFFAQLLDRAHFHYSEANPGDEKKDCSDWSGKTFLDIGSGTGRLVVGAAALHPGFKLCRGLEILPGIHQTAVEIISSFDKTETGTTENTEQSLPKEEYISTGSASEEIDTSVSDDDIFEEEPLCEGLNDIQKSLQEITPEEWKEILGDLEIDEDLLEDGGDEEETSRDIIAEKSGGDEKSINSSLSDETGADVAEEALGTNETNNTVVENASRIVDTVVVPGFILPSEEYLLDGHDISMEFKSKDVYFHSIEELECMSKEKWDILFEKENADENSKQYYFRTTDDMSSNVFSRQSSFYHNASLPLCKAQLPLAPITFQLGSFQDPYMYFGDSDVIFIFSSCMTSAMIEDLSQSMGRQCQPGSIVITTEFPLNLEGHIDALPNDSSMPFGDYKYELLETIEGYCWLTGGGSTAFIHRLVDSLWHEEATGPRVRPTICPEEQANSIISDFEALTLSNTTTFLRKVRNSMAFHDIIPEMFNEQSHEENLKKDV